MAERSDPISVAETPAKRRKLNHEESSSRVWNSDNDSGDDLAEADFEHATVATVPLGSQSLKRRLDPTPQPLRRDPQVPLSATLPDLPSSHLTQPTQAVHITQPTQPTQPLTRPTEVQVERSSPVDSITGSPKSAPQPNRRAPFGRPPGGTLANSIAPPGTAFRRPVSAQTKPAVPVDDASDGEDPPVQHSDDELTQGLRSNIKPTNFKKGGRGLDSSPNQPLVRESPQHSSVQRTLSTAPTAFTKILSEFSYTPGVSNRKSGDDMANAYGGSSRAPRNPLTHPTIKQKNVEESLDQYKSLDDIIDRGLRNKVEKMQMIMNSSVQRCTDALSFCRGNVDDALAHLADLDDAERKATVPTPVQARKGVATSSSQLQGDGPQPARPLAKQQVKAPVRTIAERYGAGASSQTKKSPAKPVEYVPEDDPQPRRRRLVQGRRPQPTTRSPSFSPPPKAPKQSPEMQEVVEIDDDDSASEREPTTGSVKEVENSTQNARDDRLLKFLNESSVRDLAELCGMPEDDIEFILEQRPFNDLDHARGITRPPPAAKSGKKSKARPKAVGEKLVSDCEEMLTGYDAVDELVLRCEQIAQPVQQALKAWGVGDGEQGELQLMKLDEAQDSGIGTPSSTSGGTDEAATLKKAAKLKSGFIRQPENMSSDLTLKDYQLVGLNWLNLLFTKKLSCILADDMGLGKTCQVIAFLSHLQATKVDGVHLIVVPGSTLENWLREFQRFAPEMTVRPYYGSQGERAELQYTLEEDFGEIDVIVTTYDMAVGLDDNKFLRRLGPYSVCVYDEAHALRNPKSNRYQQLVRLEADFKVLLTGTPLQNNLQELIAILAFIMPGLFQEKREDLEFIFKHKASTKDTAHAALLSGERIARARTMMTPFILRRKKQQVLDLPAKHSRVEFCEMTESQAAYYDQLTDEALHFYEEKKAGAKASAKASSNVIMSLRKAAIHPLLSLGRIYDDKKMDKIQAALEKSDEFGGNPPDKIRAYINGEAAISLKGGDYGLHRFCAERDFLDKFALKQEEWMDSGKVVKFKELVSRFVANGDRTLVFSQFTTVMDILEAVLETLRIKFMRLDGSTKMETRQDMIDKFNDEHDISVFMLSTRAGGAGINLASANKVIIFDSGFNPQDDIQAENRAHRVGQTREVEVVRLVSKDTIEVQIHDLGLSKMKLDEGVAGEGATAAEEKAAEKKGEMEVEKMLVQKLQGKKAATDSSEKTAAGATSKIAGNGEDQEGEVKEKNEEAKKEKVKVKAGEGKKSAASKEGGGKEKKSTAGQEDSGTATKQRLKKLSSNAGASKGADIRDAFKAGLEGHGVKVASKQAKF